ncbi:MAG: hypothetical protein ACOC40_03070 [Thermoplasmatota archaeon]
MIEIGLLLGLGWVAFVILTGILMFTIKMDKNKVKFTRNKVKGIFGLLLVITLFIIAYSLYISTIFAVTFFYLVLAMVYIFVIIKPVKR